jgi:hypothetical protein
VPLPKANWVMVVLLGRNVWESESRIANGE